MGELFPTAACVAWGVIGATYAAICVWVGVRFLNRRPRWTKWVAVALVLMPLLYVLSSGPMTIVAFRTQVTHAAVVLPDGTSAVEATASTSFGNWFPIAYAPLFWAGQQSWGDFVLWYWELFPNSGAP